MIKVTGILKATTSSPNVHTEDIDIGLHLRVPRYLLDGWNEFLNDKGTMVVLTKPESAPKPEAENTESHRSNPMKGSW